MKNLKLHPIFADCCAQDDTRYSQKGPFESCGYYAATDGHIIVRRKKLESEPDIKSNCQIDISGLGWENNKYQADGIPAPGAEPRTDGPCKKCKGRGFVRCNYNHKHDCPSCNGLGRMLREYTVEILPERERPGPKDKYVRILHRHGAVLFPSNDLYRPWKFIIPGTDIKGLVIPAERASK